MPELPASAYPPSGTMSGGTVKILRRCAKCPGEFAIRDLSSRAVYCPVCRREIKAMGMVVSLDRGRFTHGKAAA